MTCAIVIGGEVALHRLRRLTMAVIADGAGPDYDEGFESSNQLFAELRARVNPEPLKLFSTNRSDFPNTRYACQKLGLAYYQNSGVDNEYLGSWHYYVPSHAEAEGSCDDDGVPMLDIVEIRRLLRQGKLEEYLKLLEEAHGFNEPLVLT